MKFYHHYHQYYHQNQLGQNIVHRNQFGLFRQNLKNHLNQLGIYHKFNYHFSFS